MKTTLETELEKVLVRIRTDIAEQTYRSEIIFSITASGRVNDGDFLVAFKLENQYDSNCDVTGSSVEAVLTEYIRRNSWHAVNAPKCLVAPLPPHKSGAADDEIPF